MEGFWKVCSYSKIFEFVKIKKVEGKKGWVFVFQYCTWAILEFKIIEINRVTEEVVLSFVIMGCLKFFQRKIKVFYRG